MKNSELQRYRGIKNAVSAHREECFLILATVGFCWLFAGRLGVFGSRVDWISQHSVLPDYFRKLFYETGDLFPDFAANIGGGQNIYYFSYYGLYSPVVLVSYLLPFVKMSDYMMLSSVACLAAAVVLFYRWLLRGGLARRICVGSAVFFLLASPMIYQSYNQLMFVNYMPFLCLALLGVEDWAENGRRGKLFAGTFLMIMTSFYFSIGGMFALVLYGAYRYLQTRETVSAKNFCAAGIHFLEPLFLAVLTSGVLLVPTAACLLGRERTKAGYTLAELLLPQIKVMRLLYSPYGLGLTTLALTVLIASVLIGNWKDRILGGGLTVLLAVPFFGYLLNGGLYMKDKVFLPFLPLVCYLMAKYFQNFRKLFRVLPYVGTIVLLGVCSAQKQYHDWWMWAVLESVIMLGLAFLAFYKKQIAILAVPVICMQILVGAVVNAGSGKVLDRAFYEKVTDENCESVTERIAEEDGTVCRAEQHADAEENAANLNRIHSVEQRISSIYSSSCNQDYQRFRQDTYELEQVFRNHLMQSVSENPLFLDFMGVRYIISEEQPWNTSLFREISGMKVWENSDAAPICYVTDQVMSASQYGRLSFPYNQTALAEYAVVEKETKEAVLESEVKKVQVELPAEIRKGDSIRLPEEAQAGTLLFLQIQIHNRKSDRDVELTISGVRNKLSAENHVYYNHNTTFSYVIGIEEGQTDIKIEQVKGEFDIEHVEAYIGKIADQKKETLYQDEVILSEEETAGDRISGNVTVHREGYVVSSIPYDDGFEVLVDGRKVPYERVNTAFLGFKITSGEHHIEIRYRAPGADLGKKISLLGIIGAAAMSIWDRRKRKCCRG